VRPTSPEFRAAVARSHKLAVEAVLFDVNGDAYPLNLVDGSVTLDATSATRGSADLTVLNEELVPMKVGDPLTPFGPEVRVKRGIEFADGTVEMISLGIFPLWTTSLDDTGDALDMKLTLYDRSMVVSQDKPESVIEIAPGELFTESILNLIGRTFPDLQYRGFDEIDYRTPIVLVVEEQGDPWELAQNMAMACGCDLYFDGDGVLVLRSVFESEIQATLSEGQDGVLIRVGKEWTREGVHNKWIVSAETAGEATLRGVAVDDDPNSPTRYGGPFGRVPRWDTIEYIDYRPVRRQAQVDTVAQMIKFRELGRAQALSFGTLVNPALEPDDIVQITRARLGIDEQHILDSLTIPLTAEGEMSGQTRMVKLG
jgi:hypothetical protein